MLKGINVVHECIASASPADAHPIFQFNKTNHYTPGLDEPSPFYTTSNKDHPWFSWKKDLSPEQNTRSINYAMHSLIRWLIVEPGRYKEIIGGEAPTLLTKNGHVSLAWLIFAKFECPDLRYSEIHAAAVERLFANKQTA